MPAAEEGAIMTRVTVLVLVLATAIFVLISVAFPTSQSGVAVGDNGAIAHTEDGGKNWKTTNIPQGSHITTPKFNSVTFPTARLGWAVGTGGRILPTEDGGQTSPQQTETEQADNPTSPASPKVNIGKIKENQRFKSSGYSFSITVPPARNPFVRTYDFRESRLKYATYDYEEVIFRIGDFGQGYGAGVRRIPQSVLEQIAKEEPRQTLSNLANKALFQWRDNYAEKPQAVEEAFLQTQFGEGLFRVYLAKRSSLLINGSGSRESGPPKLEKSDARIAVLVVKKDDWFIYTTAEDEYEGSGSTPLDLRKQLETFFASMTVKISSGAAQGPAPLHMTAEQVASFLGGQFGWGERQTDSDSPTDADVTRVASELRARLKAKPQDIQALLLWAHFALIPEPLQLPPEAQTPASESESLPPPGVALDRVLAAQPHNAEALFLK